MGSAETGTNEIASRSGKDIELIHLLRGSPAPLIAVSLAPLLPCSSLGGFEFLDLFGKSGYDGEKVADNAVIGKLEDRSLDVFVDGDNVFGRGHSRQMLDGTADAACHVEGRRNSLACLANLVLVVDPAGIDSGAGCTQGSPERVRQRLNNGEVFRPFQAPSS